MRQRCLSAFECLLPESKPLRYARKKEAGDRVKTPIKCIVKEEFNWVNIRDQNAGLQGHMIP
jgi:hypothetical protein